MSNFSNLQVSNRPPQVRLEHSPLTRSSFKSGRGQSLGLSLFRPSSLQSQSLQQAIEPRRFQGKGSLDRKDLIDRNFQKRYFYEDWLLPRGAQVGQQIEVTLRSRRFDTFLYVADARTRRGVPLLTGADTRATDGTDLLSANSRLIFTVKPNAKYRLRVSSQLPRQTGGYTINFRVYKPSPEQFNFFYGEGLVDASVAVAKAAGKSPFPAGALLGGNDWGRDLVKAPAVWAQGITGQNVTVAVIDSGVDYTHSELKDNIWSNPKEIAANGIDDDQNGYIDDIRGWDFTGSGDNDPNDSPADGHGTHVAGMIAAARNSNDVTGVAPDAKIMPIRVFDATTTIGDPSFNVRLIQGIDYAINNGAKVINLSLRKAIQYDFELGAALQRAAQAGATVVIAAGNDRQSEGTLQPSELAFRAMVNNLGIAVGAIDRAKNMALFSNPAGRIPSNFVVAPGVGVRSSIPLEQFTELDGTSMATPHVSGVVALMLSANPNLTPAQVYNLLTRTANPEDIILAP